MSCPYDLVIFDCDGVLVHLGPVEPRVRDRLLREQGIITDIDTLSREMWGFTNEQIFAHLEAKYGAVITPDFGERYISLCYAEFEISVTAIEGVADVISKLCAAGVPICVASNGPHEQMQITLRVTGHMPYFEGAIFSAYDVPLPKPAPDLFLHAAKTMGFEPWRSVVIEDSAGGVQGGIAAGMDVLQFAAYAMTNVVGHPRVRTFKTMAELPGLLGLD
jgi:HAD superfamily hydrolase (TIGR01509 family)